MRALLNHYIRSLKEREDKPHYHQDLETFVCWLLELHDYTIHNRAYKYDGTNRKVDKGRLQQGVDILASKDDEDGTERFYRLVLKRGKIGRAEWQPGTMGNIVHDVRLAADRRQADDLDQTLKSDLHPSHPITVIAVHNGDFDTEEIGNLRRGLVEKLQKSSEVTLEWWDANKLVDIALQKGTTRLLDGELFPPSIQPFVRLVLDSLRGDRSGKGHGFSMKWVDLLLDRMLPHQRTYPSTPPKLGEALPDGEALKIESLQRKIHELGLFVGMLNHATEKFAQGNTLPVLDTTERVMCRVMEHIRRFSKNGSNKAKKNLREGLHSLLQLYVQTAQRLQDKIQSLQEYRYGLARRNIGERLDYPMRVLRFSGYLSTAGLCLLELAQRGVSEIDGQDSVGLARDFAKTLRICWEQNQGGALNPIVDDQVIELGLVWELCLRCNMRDFVHQSAVKLMERMAHRRAWGYPWPALSIPGYHDMPSAHKRQLAQAHMRGYTQTSFTDTGSTIVPLALFLIYTLNASSRQIDFISFLLNPIPGVQSSQDNSPRQDIRPVYPQTWQPPDDAPTEWYIQTIGTRGHTKVYDLQRGVNTFLEEFRQYNQPIPKSASEDWMLTVIDRMAWKVFRTPPPMNLFVQLCDNVTSDKEEN